MIKTDVLFPTTTKYAYVAALSLRILKLKFVVKLSSHCVVSSRKESRTAVSLHDDKTAQHCLIENERAVAISYALRPASHYVVQASNVFF